MYCFIVVRGGVGDYCDQIVGLYATEPLAKNAFLYGDERILKRLIHQDFGKGICNE